MKVFTEAAGSSIYPSHASALRAAGFEPVATDIDPLSIGFYLGDTSYIVPPHFGDLFFQAADEIIASEGISLVLPSLDEGLVAWSSRREYFAAKGVTVLVSTATLSRSYAISGSRLNSFKQCIFRLLPHPSTLPLVS